MHGIVQKSLICQLINQMYTKYFEVYGHCKRAIQCFINEIQATDTHIESSRQRFLFAGLLPPESSFTGFGYCSFTRKHLNRLADFYELQLVFVKPALSDVV